MQRMTFFTITLTISLQSLAGSLAGANENDAAREAPRPPEEGGPRRWQVVADEGLLAHDVPSSDAQVVETFSEGVVLANLGCLIAEDRVWCAVRPFQGGTRRYVAADGLRAARGPDGTIPTGTDDSPIRAGRGEYDVRGHIPCAQVPGESLGECAVGVARGRGGDSTVVVTFGNGFERTLYFVHGQFVRANTTMSGTGTDTDWRKEGSTHIVRVDDQRYELRDDLLFGG